MSPLVAIYLLILSERRLSTDRQPVAQGIPLARLAVVGYDVGVDLDLSKSLERANPRRIGRGEDAKP